MDTIQSTIAELHSCYERLHGEKIPISHLRERAWFRWAKAGLTVDDLRRWYYSIQIQQKKGGLAKLTFRCLIGTGEDDSDGVFERAEENCLELRRLARGAVVETGRTSILRQTGRTETRAQDTAKPISQVIARVVSREALESFKRANKELNL